ncbi:MAG: hypothetical protein KAX46_01335 [Chromatiaceae bacterium]|nr:hypothetical protein [Chromatiaceae bacterium]
MNTSDAPQFESLMIDIATMYGKPAPTDTILRLWWGALLDYPWPAVAEALEQHIRECAFFPRPADIIQQLISADGRPTGDEAWAIALQAQDEGQTVVWSAEIAEAWGVARVVLEAKDRIGARRTFLDTYGRLIADARRALRPVKWAVSLGTDTEGRRLAIEQAAHLGRLPLHQARALLAANGLPSAALPSYPAPAKSLPANVYAIPDLEHREAARFLATVRAGLAAADAKASAGKDMQTWQRQHLARGQGRRQDAAISALEHLRLSLDADATGIV